MKSQENNGFLSECIEKVKTAMHSFRLSAQVQSERHALRQLDEHALKDIGASRRDAQREAGRSFGDVPTQRANSDSGHVRSKQNSVVCGLCGRRCFAETS